MLIIDTNVLSAVRRSDRFPQVRAWLEDQRDGDLYLSAISIGEIERGIHLQSIKNPDFASDLRAWLSHTETVFTERIVPFNSSDARIWGRLSAQLGHNGADLMIAASALSREATVVTRNVSDFEPTGVLTINPFNGA